MICSHAASLNSVLSLFEDLHGGVGLATADHGDSWQRLCDVSVGGTNPG